MLNRYALFMFDTWYPGGGFNDFVSSFGTIEEAEKAAQEAQEVRGFDHTQIIDLATGKEV